MNSLRTQLTHGSDLAENPDDNEGLQDEEDGEEDQRHELIQCVEGVCAVRSYERVVPVSSPAEPSVERDISSTDEKDGRRTKDQSERDKGSVIQELVADGSVHEENPCGRNDGSNVYSREGLNLLASKGCSGSCQYRLTRRTAPSRGNQPMVKISQIEMMMKPSRNSCISLRVWSACVDICAARGRYTFFQQQRAFYSISK